MESQVTRIDVLRGNLSHTYTALSVNGNDVYYQKVGNGSKVVMLLPGIFGCSDTDFGPQIQKLDKEKFTVIAWDPPGTGKSIPPVRTFPLDYLERDARDAACLMEKLGYGRYSLLGWSDGGNTASILAAMRPDNVEKLVIWGSNSYITAEDGEMWEKIRDISNWSERMRAPLVARFGFQELQRLWNENLNLCQELVTTREGEIFSKKLKYIKAKTLILHGMKDDMVPLHHAEYLRDHIANSILECWQDGKHNLHLRFPDRFNQRVERFLTED